MVMIRGDDVTGDFFDNILVSNDDNLDFEPHLKSRHLSPCLAKTSRYPPSQQRGSVAILMFFRAF